MRIEFRSWQGWLVIVAFAAPVYADADTLSWPGSPGCTTTLQACIDAATDGDRIEIAGGTTVDENIALAGRSLTLTAAGSGIAQFAPGRSIEADAASASGPALSLGRLHLIDGHVRLRYAGTGTASYDVSQLIIERGSIAAPSYLRVEAYAGTVNATLRENRVSGAPASLNSGLIELAVQGGTLNAYAGFNKITRTNHDTLDGAGIFVDTVASGGAGAGFMRLFANEVRGGFNRSGIFFSEGLFSSTPSSYSARAFNNVIVCAGAEFGRGIMFTVNNGSIDAQAINNTVSGCETGIAANRWSDATAPSTVAGYVSNNVVTATYRGLEFTPDLTAGLSNDYNLINAPGNLAALGAHTITAPARLVAATAPRLAANSPGVDAANGTLLGNALIDAGLPPLDADGLRRVKGAGADIGAYESGDLSFEQIASTANTSGHITTLDYPGLAAGSRLFPTRNAVAGAANSYENFGVWYSGLSARWTIYHEDTTLPLAPGKAWNVFVPASGGGVFTHVAMAANSGAWQTQIDNAATNGYADRIVLVRHDWSLDGIYNDHPNAVVWNGSGGGRWMIGNADQADMTLGLGFNAYAQAPSPNAFRLPVPMGAYLQPIDHPLITGVPCAELHVTRVVDLSSPAATADFTVEYDTGSSLAGYWLVRSPVPFPANTAFNIVIDPAQVFACTDVIFADGFD